MVGPTTTAGFDSLLDNYCEARRYRGALLLNGRRDPTDGRWVCARFGDLDTIDLDDACRDAFGPAARARALDSGDIRTVRCFDS